MNRPIITIIASLLLVLTISPTAWTQGGDPNEPNDTCDLATPFELGRAIQGDFASREDVDWFTGTVTRNTTYGLFFSFVPPGPGMATADLYKGCTSDGPTGPIGTFLLDGWEGGPGGGAPSGPDATFTAPISGPIFLSLRSSMSLRYTLLVVEWPCQPLVADVTLDGTVDGQDVAATAAEWRRQAGDSKWDPRYDLDGNQIVNIIDIVRVAKDFGLQCPLPPPP